MAAKALADNDPRSEETYLELMERLLRKSGRPLSMSTLWADLDTYAHFLYKLKRPRHFPTMIQELLQRHPPPLSPENHVYICFMSVDDVSHEVVTQEQFDAFAWRMKTSRIRWRANMYHWDEIVLCIIRGQLDPLQFLAAIELNRITKPQSVIILQQNDCARNSTFSPPHVVQSNATLATQQTD